MNNFIKEIKQYRHILPKQIISTLKGQAIAGDVDYKTQVGIYLKQ